MKTKQKIFGLVVLLLFSWMLQQGFAQRLMENLGRGAVAVRSSSNEVFISWRILGLEFNSGVTYNLYRGNTRIASNLSVSNYVDNTSSNSTYSVAAVIDGSEESRSPAVGVTTYTHGSNTLPAVRVRVQHTSGYVINHVHVGDLDGDGEYDFVLVKKQYEYQQLLEAYKRDGTFLWRVECGPNSADPYDNIEPGSASLCLGHGDNWTVYDMNSDGKAEVIVRIADGVRFGDGTRFSNGNKNEQFIAILNGMTGARLETIKVPTDYITDGPMNGHMGIAYLDGVHPSVVWSSKNRIGSGSFQHMITAYTWNGGSSITMNWKYRAALPNGHNIRCGDFDGDGKDEVYPFAFMIDDNGSLAYALDVYHGDRFHIGDLDPDHPGLENYLIQQDNPNLAWAVVDAGTGQFLASQVGTGGDYARGFAGDLDPRYRGYELHTFTDGLYNVDGTRVSTAMPDSYPNLRIWWDGDVLSENLDNRKMIKWNYTNGYEDRLYTFSNVHQLDRNVPSFYGDILGDWREEVIYAGDDDASLLIFATVTPTTTRLYTLAHEPLYRNDFTTKGYYQSNMIGYYLGDGMSSPPTPNIRYVNGAEVSPTPTPGPIDPGTTVSLEAEDNYFYDGVIESEHSGYTGSGYVNFTNQAGGYAEWNVNVPYSTRATCSFVYANGSEAGRPADISVNGNVVLSGVDFPSTTEWTTWFEVTVTVNLNAGTNTIRLTGTGSEGAANIDRMDIKTDSAETPTPTPTPTGTTGSLGDVNGNNTVDIVDALLIAQYYVGLNPSGFILENADTNCDTNVNIVDALLIAQFYVGLITNFC